MGDAVYRDKTGGQNHAGLLYGYTGENVKTDLLDYSKYTVTHIAGTGHVVEEVTLTNFIGEWGYYGPYNPSSFSRGPRKAVCYTANNLLGKDYCISQPLVYYGDTWEGTPEDIKKIRCNWVSEVAYENPSDRLYGTDENWNIMVSQNNLNFHNGSDGCTPRKQRLEAGTLSPLHSP